MVGSRPNKKCGAKTPHRTAYRRTYRPSADKRALKKTTKVPNIYSYCGEFARPSAPIRGDGPRATIIDPPIERSIIFPDKAYLPRRRLISASSRRSSTSTVKPTMPMAIIPAMTVDVLMLLCPFTIR